ncbi:unnamed protein product [Gongylonema pulchrum]|uniref:Endo/exonuclease/phosphatase domain-containing protein n=1 Tax=Gongylonema pulchrum TaxID=637853 RepID=A0A183EE68_9BILA|nr:unnamed protein product [Gongylonema pulchrum]
MQKTHNKGGYFSSRFPEDASLDVALVMSKSDWKIVSITYNVNSRKPESDQISQLIREEDASAATIIAIGLQELSHSELFGTVPTEATWLSVLTAWLSSHGKSLLCKTSLAWNLLLVFAPLEIFPLVTKIDSRQSRSSLGGLTGHKGSVSLRIKFKVSDVFLLLIVSISSPFVTP